MFLPYTVGRPERDDSRLTGPLSLLYTGTYGLDFFFKKRSIQTTIYAQKAHFIFQCQSTDLAINLLTVSKPVMAGEDLNLEHLFYFYFNVLYKKKYCGIKVALFFFRKGILHFGTTEFSFFPCLSTS